MTRKHRKSDLLFAAIGYTIILPVFVACLVVLPWGIYRDFVSLKDDIWLHWFGVLARNPDAYYFHHGSRYSTGEFCVSYDTQQGESHHKCTDMLVPFVEPNRSSPLVIRYNPAAPDHASTSWGLQIVISRTFSFLFIFVIGLGLELGALAAVVKKITGRDMLATPPDTDSPASAAPSKPANQPGPGLRVAALELSATLHKILAGLQSETGRNAAYAGAVAAELAPLIAQYDRAVLEARSRDEASRALEEVAACLTDFKADQKKRSMHFGLRQMLAMRRYESRSDLFRETRYRNDSL